MTKQRWKTNSFVDRDGYGAEIDGALCRDGEQVLGERFGAQEFGSDNEFLKATESTSQTGC